MLRSDILSAMVARILTPWKSGASEERLREILNRQFGVTNPRDQSEVILYASRIPEYTASVKDFFAGGPRPKTIREVFPRAVGLCVEARVLITYNVNGRETQRWTMIRTFFSGDISQVNLMSWVSTFFETKYANETGVTWSVNGAVINNVYPCGESPE